MNVSDVRPYVRHVQRLKITRPWAERPLVPRDNRLFFCLSGCGYISVRENKYEMTRGSLLLIPAGTPYVLHIPEGEHTYIGINFDYTFAHSAINIPIVPVSPEELRCDSIIERASFSDEPLLNEPIFIGYLPALEGLLASMVVTYNKKMLYYESSLSGTLLTVISEILRARRLGSLIEAGSVIDDILSYIHNNYAEKITNSKIGEIFGYNPNYVSDLVKSATNYPLHKYVENVRTERAVDLLTTSCVSIGNIAELCGFSDIYHFSKAFKAKMGVSPAAYRKNK